MGEEISEVNWLKGMVDKEDEIDRGREGEEVWKIYNVCIGRSCGKIGVSWLI